MEMVRYNKIKSVLALKGIKSIEVYKAIGVSKVTMSRWVRNDTQPTIMKLYEVANFIGCDICDLLIDSEEVLSQIKEEELNN